MPNTYTTTSGDMWDTIALKVLGSELHKDVLIKNNLKYRHLYIFPANIVLDIPDVELQQPPTMPPWKWGNEEDE